MTDPKDTELDALIRQATALDTDQDRLARQVLARLRQPEPSRPGRSSPELIRRAPFGPGLALASFAALLLVTPLAVAWAPVGPDPLDRLLIGIAGGEDPFAFDLLRTADNPADYSTGGTGE